MFSKLKVEVLTDEEKKNLFSSLDHRLNAGPSYAVRVTNKKDDSLYVFVQERTDIDEDTGFASRSIQFELYDNKLEWLEQRSVHVQERSDRKLPTSEAFKQVTARVSGAGEKLYKKAARAAAVIQEKREELKAKQEKIAETEKRQQSSAFKAVKGFFGR